MTNEQTLVRETSNLYALKNKISGELFEITSSATVGRQKSCTIIIDDNHVSRLHANLTVSGAALVLTNESSGNGTFVNGEKIQEAVLQVGDIVKFDSYEFLVVLITKEQDDSIDENSHPIDLSNSTLLVPEAWADAKKKINDAAKIKQQSNTADASTVSNQSSNSNSDTGFLYKTEMNKILSKDQLSVEKNHQAHKNSAKINKELVTHIEEGVIYLFDYHPLVFDEVFPLNKQTILIGKSDSSDIILKDPSVSSKHAQISLENNKWILKDLSSTNGTFLNGQQISEPITLKKGDLIQFGLIQLVFGQQEPLPNSASKFSLPKWAAITILISALIAGAILFLKA